MKYLTAEQVIAINAYIIKVTTPSEFVGVKEHGSLDMAVKLPSSTSFGEELYPSFLDKVTIFVIKLVTKHCFQNANKRTAYVAMLKMLELNNYSYKAEREQDVDFIVSIATWSGTFDELKVYVKKYIEDRIEPKEAN